MKVIISPAKKMEMTTDILECKSHPHFLAEAQCLMHWLKSKSKSEFQKIWKCNDAIAELNHMRVQTFGVSHALTPAALSYRGLQYQHMAPHVMDLASLSWLNNHLRILSGLYGILRPFDGIEPYRLEMQSRLPGFGSESLYDFWGGKLCAFLASEEDSLILNLASKEYSKCITDYLPKYDGLSVVTCVFGQIVDGKIKEKGTLAKMARGDMVRYLASVSAETLDEVKRYNGLGYKFREDLSKEKTLIFIK